MFRRPTEYVCVECYGDGKAWVREYIECPCCSGTGKFYECYYKESMFGECSECSGSGVKSIELLKDCPYCQGHGTRMWIDFIKRPNKKEKELEVCLG
ncbi:MAG: hypothetical protein ABFD07_19615 [Methanobacterium sp.]